jgi:hypothetical protein
LSGFVPAWLALRESADAAARASHLSPRFAAALPRHPRILDLGAGTGANARALAPVIARGQDWWLAESDPALRAALLPAFRAWASLGGHDLTEEADAIVVAAAGARWRFAALALDLAGGWDALEAGMVDGVTASAFLDLASAAWLGRLASWLAARRLPLLATLTVTGRRDWRPRHQADGSVAAGFRRDQERDKGLGPALGAGATAVLAHALTVRGYRVTQAASDWRLGAGDGALLAALIAGEAAAATAASLADARAIAAWRDDRLAQAAAGRLSLTIGHRDLLAEFR